MRKFSITLILSAFYFFLGAQIPLPINSSGEFRYLAKHAAGSVYHGAIKPIYIDAPDTFYIKPVVEIHIPAPFGNNEIITGAGAQTFYKKDRFSVYSALIAGIGKAPDSFPNASVLLFTGKTLGTGRAGIFFDPRITLTYKTKYINFRAGRDKFHLGEGYRSVWLDNYAPALPYIGADVKVWKVLYGYRITYLQNPDFRFPQRQFYHAFNITHFFDFSFGRLNINMFETVVQDPVDSLGARRGFDFNYLNPVIFFRAVDLSLGSPDNVLLGLGGSLRLWKTTFLYGYGTLDELIVSHLLAGDKCWCLKYAANAGAKTYNFLGIKNWFVQAEASLARPYTFSHNNPVLAYGNLYQPLAHPLGANFYEALFRSIYIKNQQNFEINIQAAVYGENIDTLNYGQDIFQSYLTRIDDYGIYITQGLKTYYLYTNFVYSREIRNRFWLKLGLGLKAEKQQTLEFSPFVYLGITNQIINFRNDYY